jgi:hypothetical protein
MVSFLSDAFFKSFSSKCTYRQQQWRPLMYSLPNIRYMFSCGSHTHRLLWINGYSCTHAFLLRGGPNTSFKFISVYRYIIKIFPTKYFWPSSCSDLHRVWGRVGNDGDYWHNKQTNSWILNDIGRNSLLGKRKKIAKFLMRTFTYRSTFLYV